MQTMSSGTPIASGDDRQWQLRWGTPKPLQIGDVFEVRAFGQLEVPFQSPAAGLGYVQGLGLKLQEKLGLDPGQDKDDADA